MLAAARGLAGVSFNANNASILGRVDGLVTLVVNLARHSNPEVVSLACDVSLLLYHKDGFESYSGIYYITNEAAFN